MALDKDEVIEAFRHAVLQALDRVARDKFERKEGDAGANDSDLPWLFQAIDRQVETLAARYDVILTEQVMR